MESDEYTKFRVDGKAMISVIPTSSISHHNKSYEYENDNKYRQKQQEIH